MLLGFAALKCGGFKLSLSDTTLCLKPKARIEALLAWLQFARRALSASASRLFFDHAAAKEGVDRARPNARQSADFRVRTRAVRQESKNRLRALSGARTLAKRICLASGDDHLRVFAEVHAFSLLPTAPQDSDCLDGQEIAVVVPVTRGAHPRQIVRGIVAGVLVEVRDLQRAGASANHAATVRISARGDALGLGRFANAAGLH